MALADLRLAFLTFAQRWDGASLAATILVLPSGDPTQPLMTGTPAFAGAALQLRAAIIPSLDAMPALDTASTITRALVLNAPVNALELFGDLKTKFAPRDTSGGNPGGIAFDDRVRKALPDTYTALLPPGAQRDPNVASTEDFGCTLRGQRPPGIDPGPRTTTWGEVISHALRNPFLADALGLRYEFTLQGADAQAFAAGGWLYVTLDPADPYFAPWDTTLHDAVKSYAARIPTLTVATPSRQLFCAVLFPVANPKAAPVMPNESEIDAAIIEAQIYDDGFAEMMHARQPDSLDAHVGDGKVTANAATDAGIQIGWDDEQVIVGTTANSRRPWHVGTRRRSTSICRLVCWGTASTSAKRGGPGGNPCAWWRDGTFGAMDEPFRMDLPLEPTAVRSRDAADIEAWLPRYFAQWRGHSLAVDDPTAYRLTGGEKPAPKSALTPVLATTRLLFGHSYDFRDAARGPHARRSGVRRASGESCPRPCGQVRVPTIHSAEGGADRVRDRSEGWRTDPIDHRHLRVASVDALPRVRLRRRGSRRRGSSDAADRCRQGEQGRPRRKRFGRRDAADRCGGARSSARRHDPEQLDGPFRRIYSVDVNFPPLPADPVPPEPPAPLDTTEAIHLRLDAIDVANIADLVTPTAVPGGSVQPLPIPTSRDVRIRITPLAESRHPRYFGNESARIGLTSDLFRADGRRDRSAVVRFPRSTPTRSTASCCSPASTRLI